MINHVLGGHRARQEEELKKQSDMVVHAFGSFDQLLASANVMKQTVDYILTNMKSYDDDFSKEKSEVDDILQKMGCFNIVTK